MRTTVLRDLGSFCLAQVAILTLQAVLECLEEPLSLPLEVEPGKSLCGTLVVQAPRGSFVQQP